MWAARSTLGRLATPPASTGHWSVPSIYTTTDGFPLHVASREQAVTDALAEPAWMIDGSLLGEIVAALSDDELERTATRAIARSTAAAQRLGYLIEDASRKLPTALVSVRPVRSVQLRPGKAKGPYSTRWRVYG